MNIRDENGFTLVEIIMVLAILVVFVTAMTSLLITTTKWSATALKENENRMLTSSFFPHVERSILKYGAKNAVVLTNIAGYDDVIQIDTEVGNVSSMKLYYFYEKTTKKIYFQAETNFQPTNLGATIEIASQVDSFEAEISSLKKNLKIVVTAEVAQEAREYTKTIPLRAF